MAKTSPARIDDDLFAAAKLVGPLMSRSASQQVAHWARIGRELEASPAVSHRDIHDVLAGERAYDSLDARSQAIVRAEWAQRMAARIDDLDLAAEFTASGHGWVEADDDGNVIHHGAPEGTGRAEGSLAR